MKTGRKIYLGVISTAILTLVACLACLIGLYLGNKKVLEQYCHYQNATYTMITDEYCCIKGDTIIRIPWLREDK